MRKIIIRFCFISIKFILKLLYMVFRDRSTGIINVQGFYSAVHSLAFLFMDYLGGADFEESGEKVAMDYVAKRLKEKYPSCNWTIFDVGANIGNYSLELINMLGNLMEIHAFEPIEETFNVLSDNTLNYENIKTHNLGLSDRVGLIPVYTSKDECSEHSSIYQHEKSSQDFKLTEVRECQFDTIDHFCEDNNIYHIHFLKIDVEGHELAVLNGANKFLERAEIDYIQFEFGVGSMDAKTYIRDFWYLLSGNYNIYRIVSGGLVPIKRYKENMEIFLYSNFLAEKRK